VNRENDLEGLTSTEASDQPEIGRRLSFIAAVNMRTPSWEFAMNTESCSAGGESTQ
jgi:hypothetical protein